MLNLIAFLVHIEYYYIYSIELSEYIKGDWMKNIMMKNLIFIMILFLPSAFSQPQDFVNLLEFDNTDQQRQKVILYINNGILHKYCDSGDDACHPNVLQLAQADSFAAFLELSAVQNKEYLNKLIEENCNSEFFQCRYEDLLKVYEENFWCDVKLGAMRSAQNSEYKNRQYPNPIQTDTHANSPIEY